MRPPDGTFLHLYAADLVRSKDGQWWVVSDRTQIPAGAGYTLANRLITARVLPQPFRDCNVRRLAGFFRDLQTALARLGSRRPDNPRIVLLTPGPFNETYFEQAWLARYLGYTLVEGQDLTVRDDRVRSQDPLRPGIGGRDSAACGRRLVRPSGTAQRFHAGRSGTARGVARRVTSRWPTRSAAACCKARPSWPFFRGCAGTFWAKNSNCRPSRPGGAASPEAEQHVLDHFDDLIVQPAFRAHSAQSEGSPSPARRQKTTCARRFNSGRSCLSLRNG